MVMHHSELRVQFQAKTASPTLGSGFIWKCLTNIIYLIDYRDMLFRVLIGLLISYQW